MPIVNTTIKGEIDSLVSKLTGGDPVNDDPEKTKSDFAQGLADIIENAIKSATITIPVGTIITAGSPTTQTQSAPGIVIDGIS